MNARALAVSIGLGLLSGCATAKDPMPQTHLLVHDPPRAAGIESMIQQTAMHPEQNIQQLLIQQADNMSVHLVRIRDREQPHFHTRYDLSILLVQGEGTLWLQGEPLKMKTGDYAIVSKGTRHYFVNEGSEPAAALVVFAPAYGESDREAVGEAE